MVVPTATHSGTGLTCDKDTYQRRLWCRVELFSHYFRRGRDAMYLLQEDQTLASVDESWLLDALFAFEGDCTCCFRKHEGMKCDKPFVRDVMVGLYAELLNFKKKDDGSISFAIVADLRAHGAKQGSRLSDDLLDGVHNQEQFCPGWSRRQRQFRFRNCGARQQSFHAARRFHSHARELLKPLFGARCAHTAFKAPWIGMGSPSALGARSQMVLSDSPISSSSMSIVPRSR